MRRFVTVAALLLFTIPFGISITGCGKKTTVEYCDNNGDGSGVLVGQIATINLQPKIYGISVNQGEITQAGTPSALDCRGTPVSSGTYFWGTSDPTKTILDIQPTTGRLCGGTWNRNSGAGIADFTTCNVTGKAGIVYITATASGATSNPLPVYVHPIATSVSLGPATTDCATDPDPTTNCSPASVNSAEATSSITGCPTSNAHPNNPMNPVSGCCAIAPQTVYYDSIGSKPPQSYTANACLSQGETGQLSARVFAGTGSNRTNISCQVGHVTYSPQSGSVVTIDQNGVATAQQSGSTIIDATVSLAGSSAGYFSSCPPADISLSFPSAPAGTTDIVVNQNNTQPISATVTDSKGNLINGLSLEYTSTTPITIPAGSGGTITPVFPGQAAITAICQPPTCNNAPQSLIGVFGNGKPVTSKSLTINTPGINGTDLYIASTNSQYLIPVDFTQTQLGAPIRLPYTPNSMVISNDGSSIYMGSDTELMVVSAATGAITRQDITVHGKVLAVSPNNGTIVIADPTRQQVYLYSSAGTVTSTYGGIGTRAQWSPDSQTVYIAAGNQVLVYSQYSGWKAIPVTSPVIDVAVTVPAVGAYFAGNPATTARGYCPVTATVAGTNTVPPTVTNSFYPLADTANVATDRLAATNDGFHVLGATAATDAISDIQVRLATIPYFNSDGTTINPVGTLSPSGGINCPAYVSGNGGPLNFTNSVANIPLTGITPSTITGVLPTSNSKLAFITYTGTGGVLPAYAPPVFGTGGNTSGVGVAGTLTNIPLSGSAVAPVGGAVSADNSTIYVGTSGDALIHIINTGTLTDTKTIAPNLPIASGITAGAAGTVGNIAVPDLLVEKPRPST